MKDKLNKMNFKDLYDLKCIVDSLSNYYAERLTDYALISGNNNLDNLSRPEKEIYEKRRKYQESSECIMQVLEEKVNEIL